jgi:diguanylate cyclase (GGDEF)-like protein
MDYTLPKRVIVLVTGCLLLGVAYFSGGTVGILLQSEQPGVSPLWPSSGIAFAVLYLYGYRFWPGIILGMLGIAAYVGTPTVVALVASSGAILEAVIPVFILRHLDVDIRFRQLNHIVQFCLFAVIIGPAFSATSGIIALELVHADFVLPESKVWFTWWTGSAIGMLIVGSLIITWAKNRLPPIRVILEISLYAIITVLLCLISFTRENQFLALLVMYLSAPLVVATAIRCRALGVTAISIIALLMFLVSAQWLPQTGLSAPVSDLFYAQLLFIAISCALGLFVAAAYEERTHHDRLAYEASHDGLTGLLNRKGFYESANDAINTARAYQATHTLAFIDLDNLKAINDNAGHLAGDKVIQSAATCIDHHVRSRDCAARIGGDEFVLIFFYCSPEQGKHIARQILASINEQSIEHEGNTLGVKASMGLSVINHMTTDYQEVLKAADTACYQAKRSGKNRLLFADELC